MRRRSLLAGAAAAAIVTRMPARARAAGVTLRHVPSSNLTQLDPTISTAFITLCHGYAVFDTLYGADSRQRIRPQMAEGHTVSDDGLTWLIRLREGLAFHDGTPVRATDCAASLSRWAALQATGQLVGTFADSFSAQDDRTIKVALKRKLPTLAYLMAMASFPPFMMPERLARTDPHQPIQEMVGSGPFRFKADEYVSGSLAVYEKFAGYVPRAEPPDWTSGGKIAHVDRVEWPVIPDNATAAAALLRGEVDWLARPLADLIPALSKSADIGVAVTDPTGWFGMLRFNTLQPPFDNVRVRQAVMMAVNPEDYMRVATNDDPSSYTVCRSMFPCGTLLGTETGTDAMQANLETARAMLQASGYAQEKVVLLSPSDSPPIGDFAAMAADTLQKLGMNVDLVVADWGTVTQRRASKEPTGRGGWSMFVTLVGGSVMLNPAVNFLIRGQGQRGYFGWYENPLVEALTQDWLQSSTDTDRLRIGDAIQREAFRTAPVVPVGQFVQRTAFRKTVHGILQGPAVLLWNVDKEAG